MDRRLAVALGGAAMVVLVAAGCSSAGTEADAGSTAQPPAGAQPGTGSPAGESAEQPGEPAAQPAGGYIDYADYRADPAAYSGGDVVLFFNASWCPTCQEAAGNLIGADYPAGLTVVSVDYDDNTALRQQYGVTVQHTFVQVDPSGGEITKWTGSTTLDGIEGQLA